MLKGFLGVFIILGIIIVVTVLLNAVTKKGEKNVRSILLCSVVLLAVVGAAVAFALL